jgi:hypothetical protein
LLSSFKVTYKTGKCRKLHSIGESAVLPAATDTVEIMFGESHAKEFRKIPLTDNTVDRILHISKELCDQYILNFTFCIASR